MPRRPLPPALAFVSLSLAVAACAGGAADPSGASHPLMGKPAPEISAEPVGGEGPKTLKEAQGKVTIVDFWATYCDPCKGSFPKYQAIVDQFPGQVAVIAVSIDDPESVQKEKLLAFAGESQARFALAWDKKHGDAGRYGVESLPTSFILDRQGVVRRVHVDFHKGEEAAIAAEVKALLEQPPAAPASAGAPSAASPRPPG
jgi:cytochrome c biogenesis protein CcmG, thiol:disulfide interchange protein DsbE